MKKGLLFSAIFLLILNAHAQRLVKRSDITMSNLGDTQMYANKNDEKKTPLDGKCRIFNGITTEYIEANFLKGFAEGKWEYYVGNRLTLSANFQEGYLEGDYVEYYEDDKISLKGAYVKGKRIGKWEHFNRDGKLIRLENCEDGKSSIMTDYYANGQIKEEIYFKGGKENGSTKRYDEEGKLYANLNYVDGKQVGKQYQSISSNTGDYILNSNYNEEGRLHGDYEEIYVNFNTPKETGTYRDGQKDGTWKKFKSDGTITLSEVFEKGKLRKKTTFYNDGTVELEQAFLDGRLHGTSKKFEYGGDFKYEKNYVNGIEVGKQVQIISSNTGSFKMEYMLNEFGKKEGKYLEVYIDGNEVKVEGEYVNDKKEGEWTSYRRGRLDAMETYKNGTLQGKQSHYVENKDGDYIVTFNLDDKGRKEGAYEEVYFSDKSVKKKGQYLYGDEDGFWQYYSHGKMIKEEKYDRGKLLETRIIE